MNRTGRIAVGLVLSALGLGSSPADAAEASASLSFSNAYIWRGLTFNDTGVSQFSVDVGGNLGSVPISFNVWGNLDLGSFEDTRDTGKFFEIDLTLTAELPAGFSIGYIEYIFPANADGVIVTGTRELFVGWSKEMAITPSVTLYYDVDAVEDYYATLSLGWSHSLSDSTSLDLGVLAGVAGEDFAVFNGGEEGGLYNYDLNAGISHQASDAVGIGATVGYAGSLDENVLPEQPLGFYFAAGLDVSF